MSDDWLTGPILEQLNSGVLVVDEEFQLGLPEYLFTAPQLGSTD